MEARLRSLANRAVRAEKASDDPFDDADVESLLDVLLKRIRRKRDFEAAFSSSEGAESFAKGAGLSDKQKHLLLVMQNQKEIYKPNQVLDAILTLAFAGTCAVLARVLWKQGLLTGFVLGLLVCHSVVHRIRDLGASVAHAIGNWATRRGLVDSNPFTSTLQMKKWQDQFWQLAVHVVASATEFYILSTEKWWDQPETCWSPTPSEQLVNPVRMDLKLLYISQLAIWTYTAIMHRFYDERRRDYFILYCHHLVTIALVLASWYGGCLRIGLLVLYVHDVSDIFVDGLKMVNLTKLEGRRGWFLSEFAYATCILTWVYYRMWQFPLRVMKGASIDAYRVLGPAFPGDGTVYALLSASTSEWAAWLSDVHHNIGIPFFLPGNVLLLTLFALHVYWFHLLFMIGYRIATESAREASRQEYEGDSEAEEEGDGAMAGSLASAGGGHRAGRGAGKALAAAAASSAEDPVLPALSPVTEMERLHSLAAAASASAAGRGAPAASAQQPTAAAAASRPLASPAAAGASGDAAAASAARGPRAISSPNSGSVVMAAARRR